MSLAPRALLGALPAHAAISACEFQRDPAPMRPGPNADGIAAVPTLGEWSLLMLGTLLGLGGVRRVAGSKVDATAVLFPVPVAGWLGAFTSTVFDGAFGLRARHGTGRPGRRR